MPAVKDLPSLAEAIASFVGSNFPAPLAQVPVETIFMAAQRVLAAEDADISVRRQAADVAGLCLRLAWNEIRVRQLTELVAAKQATIEAQKSVLDLRQERGRV